MNWDRKTKPQHFYTHQLICMSLLIVVVRQTNVRRVAIGNSGQQPFSPLRIKPPSISRMIFQVWNGETPKCLLENCQLRETLAAGLCRLAHAIQNCVCKISQSIFYLKIILLTHSAVFLCSLGTKQHEKSRHLPSKSINTKEKFNFVRDLPASP